MQQLAARLEYEKQKKKIRSKSDSQRLDAGIKVPCFGSAAPLTGEGFYCTAGYGRETVISSSWQYFHS